MCAKPTDIVCKVGYRASRSIISLVVYTLLGQRIAKAIIGFRTLVHTEQVVRISVKNGVDGTFGKAQAGEVVCKLLPGALLNTSSTGVLAEIAKGTGGNAPPADWVCECHVRTVEDALSSDVVSIVVWVRGTDWHANVGIIVGVGVWLGWTS